MERLPPPLGAFLRDLDELAATGRPESEFLPALSEKLHRLLLQPGALPSAYLRPRPDHYGRYLLRRDPKGRFVVVALSWGEGQCTPVHDHGCWSMLGVYQNSLRVTNFLRLDDRSVDGRSRLERRDQCWLRHGSVGFVYPPNEEIHEVGNPLPGDAVCINIYGKEVERVNLFDVDAGTHRLCDPLEYHNSGRPVPAREQREPFAEFVS